MNVQDTSSKSALNLEMALRMNMPGSVNGFHTSESTSENRAQILLTRCDTHWGSECLVSIIANDSLPVTPLPAKFPLFVCVCRYTGSCFSRIFALQV